MPRIKICSNPNCNKKSIDGNPKCLIHRRFRNKPRNEEVIERSTFYNTTRWTKFSKSIRAEHPVCEMCNNEITSDCDHFIERSIDYRKDYEFDHRNMVCMCKSCHYTKGLAVKRMIDTEDYHRIYMWMLNNHPRKEDTDYLHEWVNHTLSDFKQGIQNAN